MSLIDRPPLFRQKRLKEFRGRGRLYSWLRAHSEQIAPGLESGEYSWAMLCAECARHGVTGRHGEAPTRKAAWAAWQTLCNDLAASGETPANRSKKPKPPSRFPKDWSPTVLREQEIPVPAYLRPAGAEVPPYLRPPSMAASVPAPVRPPPLPAKPAAPAGNEVTAQRPKRGSMDAALDKLGESDWWLGDGRPKPRSDER